MRRDLYFLFFMFLTVPIIALSACGGAAPQPTATNPPTQIPPTVEPTKVPPTDTPTVVPTVAPTPTATEQAAEAEVARPSNGGGPGEAVNLKADTKAGAQVYTKTCAICHGDQGKGGVVNKGSDDGTVPPLNPIDSSLIDKDAKVYATNIDLFLEHGSKPEGDNPEKVMLAYGEKKLLTQQQIADVIAYLISLNPAQ